MTNEELYKKITSYNIKSTIAMGLSIIGVVWTMFVFFYDKNEEFNIKVNNQLKWEIERLDIKNKNQRDTIKYYADALNKMHGLLEEFKQNRSTSKKETQQTNHDQLIINNISDLIIEGDELKQLNTSEKSTYKRFLTWRNNCIANLSKLNSDFANEYLKEFEDETKLINESKLQMIPFKTNKGLEKLNIVRVAYKK